MSTFSKACALTAVAVAGTGWVVSTGATERDPQVGAYFTMQFGQPTLPRAFHYGLRLDQDSYTAQRNEVPPLMVLDFSSRRGGLTPS